VPSLGYSRHYKLLKEINLPVPPIEEQKAICAELDALSLVIEKKKEQIKQLDNLAQSIFYDTFGDPATNKRNFTITNIGKIAVLKSGNSEANNSMEGDLPYVKVGDMNISGNENYITTSSRFVDRLSNKKNIFPKGTIIFPKRGGAIGTNKKRLCKVDICCDLNTMGVIPDKGVVEPLYVFQYFKNIDLGRLCNGATIPQINNGDIAPLKILLPPLSLQQTFAERIEGIERQKELINQSIREVQTLFDSRMDYYFRD
jgi:type I restriction enzyme S subunit